MGKLKRNFSLCPFWWSFITREVILSCMLYLLLTVCSQRWRVHWWITLFLLWSSSQIQRCLLRSVCINYARHCDVTSLVYPLMQHKLATSVTYIKEILRDIEFLFKVDCSYSQVSRNIERAGEIRAPKIQPTAFVFFFFFQSPVEIIDYLAFFKASKLMPVLKG